MTVIVHPMFKTCQAEVNKNLQIVSQIFPDTFGGHRYGAVANVDDNLCGVPVVGDNLYLLASDVDSYTFGQRVAGRDGGHVLGGVLYDLHSGGEVEPGGG
jgi:hypothetical protein